MIKKRVTKIVSAIMGLSALLMVSCSPGGPGPWGGGGGCGKNNMLKNGTFKAELSQAVPDGNGNVDTEESWIFILNNGAEATAEIVSEVLKVVPTNIDAPEYGIQLIQSPLLLERADVYKVSFWAAAEEERDITFKIGATGDRSWTAYVQKTFTLTTKMTEYEFEFEMSQADDENTRFEVWFTASLSPVYMDNLYMEKIEDNEPPAPLEEGTLTEADEDTVEDWQLVWADEFDGDAIDTSIWSFEIGNGYNPPVNNPGWGNAELEYYTDEAQNASIVDGKLVITAIKEDVPRIEVDPTGVSHSFDYTSARMISRDNLTMHYGRVEIRAKLPIGQGIWPALWLLGDDLGTVGWPQCGEIDIMEYLGHEPKTLHGTVHGPVSGGPGVGSGYEHDAPLSDDFHIYSIEWDENEVEFYFDDILYHVAAKRELDYETGASEWVYDHPHFFILNIAVGGNWPGNPDSTTVFPQTMEIDYIRMYQDADSRTVEETYGGLEKVDCEIELNGGSNAAGGIETFTNGTFDTTLTGWSSYVHNDGAAAELTSESGEAKVAISSVGAETWGIQFFQGPFAVTAGTTYTVEFDARSTMDRKIEVLTDNAEYARFLNETIDLTAGMQHYQFTFTMTGDDSITLKFLLGNTAGEVAAGSHDIYIDNVTFTAN